MSIEKNLGDLVEPTEAGKAESKKIERPGEKLKGFRRNLWEKVKTTLTGLGVSFSNGENLETEEVVILKIKEIRNKNEEDKFLDIEFEGWGDRLNFRTVAQIDPGYNPDRVKNYNEWDLTPQEEAERWLNREILVNEKLAKFTKKGVTVSADELVKSHLDPKNGPMFLLKRTVEQGREQEEYGEAEGRALAKTLLDMQENLLATEMVKEIMAESGIKTKLEMEQKIFEDYFDHFDGYMDNSKVILGELGDEGLARRLKERMEKFREVIESVQLESDEYSLVHGNINFDTVKYTKDGRAFLSGWQRAGKTQNKALSLVYDLGDALQEAVSKLEIAPAKAFIKGVEAEIRASYQDRPELAEAIINLTKLRSFAMIVNDIEGDKKSLVLKGLGEVES